MLTMLTRASDWSRYDVYQTHLFMHMHSFIHAHVQTRTNTPMSGAWRVRRGQLCTARRARSDLGRCARQLDAGMMWLRAAVWWYSV
jgi:hypothetical protein